MHTNQLPRMFRPFWLAVLILSFSIIPAHANLDVRGAILMNMGTGSILYAQGADKKIPPASLTKIMTMYVVMDHVKAGKVKLTDKVKISQNAGQTGGSRMHIKAGETVTLDKLLTGVAVSSGNDAAVAVAEHVAGSTKAFVALMNAKAKKLGMKNTVFKNPHGLPAEGQITTARDMMALSRNYMKTHPSSMKYHRIQAVTHRGVTTTNKNPLLKSCPGADGLKTGWIRASGYNLVSTVKRGQTRLLAVVLGSPNAQVRAKESRSLVEAGFKSVDSKGKLKVSEVLAQNAQPKKKTGQQAQLSNKKPAAKAPAKKANAS